MATLLALAQFYDVDLVRNKCERHLKCHEMPYEERIVLAKKYGLKEVSVGFFNFKIYLLLFVGQNHGGNDHSRGFAQNLQQIFED